MLYEFIQILNFCVFPLLNIKVFYFSINFLLTFLLKTNDLRHWPIDKSTKHRIYQFKRQQMRAAHPPQIRLFGGTPDFLEYPHWLCLSVSLRAPFDRFIPASATSQLLSPKGYFPFLFIDINFWGMYFIFLTILE